MNRRSAIASCCLAAVGMMTSKVTGQKPSEPVDLIVFDTDKPVPAIVDMTGFSKFTFEFRGESIDLSVDDVKKALKGE